MNGVRKSKIKIPVRDGTEIPAVLWQPETPPKDGSPLLVTYHGGGWCMGSPEMEEVNCVNCVQKFGVVAVGVDYRLAPEHAFPGPVQDSWDALKWIAEHAHDLKADPTQGFVVGGESAGGNLTIIMALMARDEKLNPPLTGAAPAIPSVCSKEAVPERFKKDYHSKEQNYNAACFPGRKAEMLIDVYNPDRFSPLFNPLLWPTGHRNLPPMCFQINGMDPLRDEGLIYERLLREECGVKTKLSIYPGMPHGFHNFVPTLQVARKYVQDALDGYAWLFARAEA
ncbi:hypothetical protein K490DRAFT_41525 [Saccharata proteae CBS 121410]|uniref:Alpha/beta hydrolase fold-3 domain-containing protein n=1 Tax=Saccharata proteae CBS 121410 TaxID=1314787 RepID=A0A9P4HTB9_9PEZI|nr:hypothetical protein K490DRAFT_41525 [Saccharata proteae CBS 121410]